MTESSDLPRTITIPPEGAPFYWGVAAGSKIRDAHDPVHDLAGSDAATRSRMFWFYAGAVAAGDHGIDGSDDEQLALFLAGAATRAPSESDRLA